MTNKLKFLFVIALFVFYPQCDAKTLRRNAAINQFKRLNHCPSTGLGRGSCPGYIIDHIVPLACGGPDRPDNMQWQTIRAAKSKDKIERKQCKR